MPKKGGSDIRSSMKFQGTTGKEQVSSRGPCSWGKHIGISSRAPKDQKHNNKGDNRDLWSMVGRWIEPPRGSGRASMSPTGI